MEDIFISKLGKLLEGWQMLAPDAVCYQNAEILPTVLSRGLIFWLHVDAFSQEEMRKGINSLRERDSTAKVIVLANVPEQQDAMLAFERGALGYTHAYHDSEVLRQVRQVVQYGGVWLGQEMLLHLIQIGRQLSGRPDSHIAETLALLTPREREVATRAAQGLSNKVIAREMDITERTVKAHLSAIFERIGVKDRLQLAIRINERLSS